MSNKGEPPIRPGVIRAEDRVTSWRGAIAPYIERGPLIALAVGLSSGFPYAMIGATLTSRLAQDGIDKKSVTAFSLVFFAYNFKWLWAWLIDGVRLPLIGRMGQRVSWMLLFGLLVIAADFNLAMVDPRADLAATALAAILLGIAGASFDIVIDAYRIESLDPHQLGAGAGMSQYGWRLGSAGAGALALYLAQPFGWTFAYAVCAIFALPAMMAALIAGEPERHVTINQYGSLKGAMDAIIGPILEFFARQGAWLVLLFILLHKIGDTAANLTFRLLFDHLQFSNVEIANYDVAFGLIAYLAGIFIGGIAYARLGMKWSVMASLILMAVSNLGFAALAAAGHSNLGMAGAIGFENVASGFGGVAVTAYFSALCNLRFTATQYAMISAASSIAGRFLTGTSAGALIDAVGYVDFYLLTTLAALPGVLIFAYMIRSGLVDAVAGSAAKVRAPEAETYPCKGAAIIPSAGARRTRTDPFR